MNRLAKFLRDYSFARFFIPAGIILLVFGIVIFGITDKRKDYPQMEATVTSAELYEEAYDEGDIHHDSTYRVFIKYTVDGKEYETEYGIVPQMKVGTTVKINYNPSDPADISEQTRFLLPIGMIAAGAASLTAGCISIYVTHNKNKVMRQQEEEWHNG